MKCDWCGLSKELMYDISPEYLYCLTVVGINILCLKCAGEVKKRVLSEQLWR